MGFRNFNRLARALRIWHGLGRMTLGIRLKVRPTTLVLARNRGLAPFFPFAAL